MRYIKPKRNHSTKKAFPHNPHEHFHLACMQNMPTLKNDALLQQKYQTMHSNDNFVAYFIIKISILF